MDGTTLADRLQEKVSGVCLIVGPLLLTASTFLWVSPDTLYAAGLTTMLAFVCFLPATRSIAGLLRERAPRIAVLGGLLATTGCVGGVNFGTAGLHEWVARTAGVSEATMAEIAAVVESQLFPAIHLFGITFPISMVILSAGLFRTGVVPKWVAIMLGLGAIAFPLGRIPDIRMLQHLADLLLLVPMWWIALRFLAAAAPKHVAAPAAAGPSSAQSGALLALAGRDRAGQQGKHTPVQRTLVAFIIAPVAAWIGVRVPLFSL